MGKLLKWGALTLVVLLLVSTIIFGVFFEKNFDEAHQRLADQYDMEYTKPRNNHGLFTSDIEVCFRPRSAAFANGASLCAAYAVQYGPILWHGGLNVGWMSAQITPSWPAEMDSSLRMVFGDEPALQLALQARFFDQIYIVAKTPKLKASDKQKFAMEPLQWHNWIDLRSGQYRTEGEWASIDVKEPIVAQMKNLSFSGEFVQDSSKLWLGSVAMKLDQLSVSNQGVNMFELRLAEYAGSTQNNSNAALSDHTLNVKWQRMQVAQQIPTSGDVHIIMEGVNKQAIQKVQSISQSMSGSLDPKATAEGMAAIQQLINSGLKLRIEKLDIGSDSTHARGKGEFVLTASDAPDAMMTAMQRVEGKLNWTLPLALVDQWVGNEVIQQWLADNRIWLEGDLVHFDLTMSNGQMHLGTWQVPLPGSQPAPMVEMPVDEVEGIGSYDESVGDETDSSKASL